MLSFSLLHCFSSCARCCLVSLIVSQSAHNLLGTFVAAFACFVCIVFASCLQLINVFSLARSFGSTYWRLISQKNYSTRQLILHIVIILSTKGFRHHSENVFVRGPLASDAGSFWQARAILDSNLQEAWGKTRRCPRE